MYTPDVRPLPSKPRNRNRNSNHDQQKVKTTTTTKTKTSRGGGLVLSSLRVSTRRTFIQTQTRIIVRMIIMIISSRRIRLVFGNYLDRDTNRFLFFFFISRNATLEINAGMNKFIFHFFWIFMTLIKKCDLTIDRMHLGYLWTGSKRSIC